MGISWSWPRNLSLVAGLAGPLLYERGYSYGWGMTLAPHGAKGPPWGKCRCGTGDDGRIRVPLYGDGTGHARLVIWSSCPADKNASSSFVRCKFAERRIAEYNLAAFEMLTVIFLAASPRC